MEKKDNQITFKFEGGIADDHEMNFYEAARFQYAAARVIYKLEHYRITGSIVQRVSIKIDTDIRIGAANAGSWELGVLLGKAAAIKECSIKVPLDKFLGFFFNKIKPKSRGRSLALELAKIDLAKEKERTKQSAQETERMKIMQEVVRTNNATTQQALSILENVQYEKIEDQKLLNVRNAEDLEFVRKELEADLQFDTLIEPYLEELEDIPAEDEAKLIDMFRQASNDLALPLRNSAETLSIAFNGNKNICVFDRESLESLSDEIVDEDATILLGGIKAYDKETGWGKFRNNEDFVRPIPFCVNHSQKNKKLSAIMAAMAEKEIYISFNIVRDKKGTPIRLRFIDIVDMD